MEIPIFAMLALRPYVQVVVLKSGDRFDPEEFDGFYLPHVPKMFGTDQHHVVCLTKFRGKFFYLNSEGRPGRSTESSSEQEVTSFYPKKPHALSKLIHCWMYVSDQTISINFLTNHNDAV